MYDDRELTNVMKIKKWNGLVVFYSFSRRFAETRGRHLRDSSHECWFTAPNQHFNEGPEKPMAIHIYNYPDFLNHREDEFAVILYRGLMPSKWMVWVTLPKTIYINFRVLLENKTWPKARQKKRRRISVRNKLNLKKWI